MNDIELRTVYNPQNLASDHRVKVNGVELMGLGSKGIVNLDEYGITVRLPYKSLTVVHDEDTTLEYRP